MSEASTVSVIHRGTLADETFGILPQIGALAFKDANDSRASRGALGAGFDFNLANLEPLGPKRLFAGISTGAMYSHVGGVDANFFGYNSAAAPGSASSDVVIFPADIKVGYNVTESFRVSVHGGANAIYNSQPGSIQLGNGNHWNFFPDAGGSIEFGWVKNISVGLRPDITFTPASDFFTGSLQLGYIFG